MYRKKGFFVYIYIYIFKEIHLAYCESYTEIYIYMDFTKTDIWIKKPIDRYFDLTVHRFHVLPLNILYESLQRLCMYRMYKYNTGSQELLVYWVESYWGTDNGYIYRCAGNTGLVMLTFGGLFLTQPLGVYVVSTCRYKTMLNGYIEIKHFFRLTSFKSKILSTW